MVVVCFAGLRIVQDFLENSSRSFEEDFFKVSSFEEFQSGAIENYRRCFQFIRNDYAKTQRFPLNSTQKAFSEFSYTEDIKKKKQRHVLPAEMCRCDGVRAGEPYLAECLIPQATVEQHIHVSSLGLATAEREQMEQLT